MRLLDAVKQHLEPEGFAIGVGQRPADVDDGHPFAVVDLMSTTFPDEANDVELHDEAATSVVQVACYGRHAEAQAGALQDRLDTRLRDALTVPGHAVHLVARESRSGPHADRDAAPDRPMFAARALFRIDTAPL